jgi:hypothetical protein
MTLPFVAARIEKLRQRFREGINPGQIGAAEIISSPA